jgi:tetratricopeptide (TPR) repeat protein
MSAKTVFISYRRDAIGRAFARSLKQELTRHGYDAFFDVDSMDPGKWADQIRTEVSLRSHFLLLLTPGALERCTDEDDWVRREFETAVRSGRNIVLVREESVDLAKLRHDCPASMKGLFDFQIATVRQEGFENDIEELIDRYIPPHKAPKPSQTSATGFHADISRIDKYAPSELIGREDELKLLNDAWDKAIRGEPKRPHILTFVALGGEGKTSLVAKWAASLAFQDWPGCDAVFAWSFYSQGTREQVAASSDLFLREALVFFGDSETAESSKGAHEKGKALANLVASRRSLLILDGLEPLQYAPTSPTPGELKDQGIAALLKGLAAASRGLCVVTTRYSLPDLRAFWQTNAPEVKLLRLSRDAGVHLLKTLGVKGSEWRNLPLKDGDPDSEKVNEFEKLVEDVKGHALTLNLLGSYLRDAHGGDLRKRDLIDFADADAANEHKHHVVHVMDTYVRWLSPTGFRAWSRRLFSPEERETQVEGKKALAVLRLVGLFDRPVTDDCLGALLKAPAISDLTEPLVKLNEAQRNTVLTRLEDAKLLTVNRDASGALVSLDAHPHLREYFARQLRTQQPDAWRAAHRRLYEYLCETTREGDQPTLEDLQPLYQAVAHGCQARMQREALLKVYFARILRSDQHYTWHKLGAYGSELGAQACFFEHPWTRLTAGMTESEQAWLVSETGFCLRALGRLTEALEPMRAGLKMRIKQEVWKSAAIIASNLSELELTLGEVAGAVGDAEQSVTHADRSGDAGWSEWSRTTLANALNQAGRQDDSRYRFQEAEALQKEVFPTFAHLFGEPGFSHCDFLLVVAERSAWQAQLGRLNDSAVADTARACRDVKQRALTILDFDQKRHGTSLLEIALDHLTLSRAAFYEVVLVEGSLAFKTQNSELKTSIAVAVDGLRRANAQEFIVRGLLTRAWLRFLTGARTGPESAQEDLDEAWEIAERGPMRLFMADIHLYRARLFGGMKDEGGRMTYPWDKNPDGTPRGPKDDLAAARKLIEQCGYFRRKEELEDAEEASQTW